MWPCRKCGKPVYFAERRQSLGFDWHPTCLCCEECGKRLNPGQHAEHKGVPYCHHPCYGALFGPQIYGHGTRNECHASFGNVENKYGQVKRSHLEVKLKEYNKFFDGSPGELKSREVNGRLILEGVLRIHWGVRNVIHLKQEDEVRRQSIIMLDDDTDDDEAILWRDDSPNGRVTPMSPGSPCSPQPPSTPTSSNSNKQQHHPLNLENGHTPQSPLALNKNQHPLKMTNGNVNSSIDSATTETVNGNSGNGDVDNSSISLDNSLTEGETPRKNADIRRRPGRRMDKTKIKRRASINGHLYLRETSSFTPPHGAACSVWVTSLVTSNEVLNMLLDKYKVEMSRRSFALFVMKDNGERRRVRDDESPLISRVIVGPHEDVAKIFIVDVGQTQEISPEVAQFLNLSLTECRAILHQYEQEEQRQIRAIKQKYDDMKFYMQHKMKELRGV